MSKQKLRRSPSERSLILIAGLLGVFLTQSAWAGEIRGNEEKILPALAQSPASNTQSPIQVTGVRLNKTETEIEVILETKEGKKLQVTNRTQGNSVIAVIPNAVLVLPNNTFPLLLLWGNKNRGEMMKLRFGQKISDRKLIETSKQGSIGKIFSGQGLQIIFCRK
ncbi:AMIN domain-containing protein [Nostoc sp.]|uniref:AMIN domain-containing protein n=1 Tax=Nostoc sp. TaxID=1180 RepID=UPI002FF9DB7F